MLFQLIHNHLFHPGLYLIFPGRQHRIHIVASDDGTNTASADILQNGEWVLRRIHGLHRIHQLIFYEKVHIYKIVITGNHQRVRFLRLVIRWIVTDRHALYGGIHLLYTLDKRNLKMQPGLRDRLRRSEGCKHRLLLFLNVINRANPYDRNRYHQHRYHS